MDHMTFDIFARSLSAAGSRRSVVRLVAALPLGVMLTTLLSDGQDATAKDDDHGSSHRQHRRKARHKHQTGKNKENRKGQRRGKRNGQGKGTDTGVATNPCQGKLDRTCCGAPGHWCQGGACVVVPDAVTATLAECGGRCDFPGRPATLDVCGKTAPCPTCSDCTSQPCANCGVTETTCSDFAFMFGPAGDSVYCTSSFGGGVCNGSHAGCGPDQGCSPFGFCQFICDGKAP